VPALEQRATAIPQIPKIFPSFILRISFYSQYVVLVPIESIAGRSLHDAAHKLRLTLLHGLCHHEKAGKPRKNDRSPAQTLLKPTGYAQILRRLTQRIF
jgi:hypothetical protein